MNLISDALIPSGVPLVARFFVHIWSPYNDRDVKFTQACFFHAEEADQIHHIAAS